VIHGVLLNLAVGNPPQKRRGRLLAEHSPMALSKCGLADLPDCCGSRPHEAG
jgi:hypothetical protein